MSSVQNTQRFVPVIERAHDVRRLRVCMLCETIGHADYMLENKEGHMHGSCFIERHGRKALLDFPEAQTDKLCMADIGPQAMMFLLRNRGAV